MLLLNKAKLKTKGSTGRTKDDILGDLLYTTALSYYAELDVMDFVSAKIMGLVAIRLSSENIFSSELRVNSFFGIPLSVSSDGLAMDVDRAMTLVKALDGSKEKPKQFFLSSGMNGSVLEHSVAEQLFSTPENPTLGISAIKALQIANDQGIPIYKINLSNINTVLPYLQVDANVKADIQNAVNAGKEVTVSKTDVTFDGWTGCGYIIIDPATGTGAYIISGGMDGAIAIGVLAGMFYTIAKILLSQCVKAVLLGGPAAVTAIILAIGFSLAALAACYLSLAYLAGDKPASEFFKCLLGLYIGNKIVEALVKTLAETFIRNFMIFLDGAAETVHTVACIDEFLHEVK